MHQSIMGLGVCVLSVAACNFEHYGEEDCIDEEDPSWGASSSGPSGPAEPPAAAGGGGSSGGAPKEPAIPPVRCEDESDCAPGFNCHLGREQCLPASAETCGELKQEWECSERSDCTPVYAGIGCSCGTDCECVGGEPGCICESFEFFACMPAAG